MREFFKNYFWGFFLWVIGLVMVFGLWVLRTRPFWDDRSKYSDETYNTMWTLTGLGVFVGALMLVGGYMAISWNKKKRKNGGS